MRLQATLIPPKEGISLWLSPAEANLSRADYGWLIPAGPNLDEPEPGLVESSRVESSRGNTRSYCTDPENTAALHRGELSLDCHRHRNFCVHLSFDAFGIILELFVGLPAVSYRRSVLLETSRLCGSEENVGQ